MSSAGRGFRFNEGDWTCPECNNVNFARRSQCNRCGTERKYEVKKIKKGGIEIGKMAAEKSKGLFSADDWMCKTCGNVNWARRNDCNMCNTPKVNIQEERTGYGGGFNERDGVEYKEKEDSDGELDEFGRRKKKFRGKPPSVTRVIASSTATEEEGQSDDDEDVSKYDLDADDDEDEDDDGDASKYDLAASDEENDKKSKRSSSRSRSRSRSRSQGRRRSYSSSSRSRSRSRSNSRSRRRKRSRSRSSSRSSSDRGGRRRHDHRRRDKRNSRSRSRSRSPLHRHRRSSSKDRYHRRH